MVRALFGNNIPPAAEAVEELQNAIEAGKFFPPKIRLRLLAVGSQTSGLVKIYRIIESRQPVEIANFYAFDSQAVSVAIGDVTGDGIADVVVGGNSEVRIFRGAMSGESGLSFAISGFFAPYPGFAGGVNVATGDFNGDGKIDIITGAGAGGGPHVKVFDGATDFNTTTHSFFAYDQAFRGGVYVALGDFNGDHHAELVTSPGPGGGPHVKTWRGVGTTGTPVQYENYMAYDEAFRGGVSIACADMDNDGRTDLVTGALKGGGPHAKFFSGRTDNVIMSQFVYPEEMKAGIAVAAGYIFGERSPAFVVGPATASNNSVILYSWQAGQNLKEEARLSPFPGEGVSLAIGVSF